MRCGGPWTCRTGALVLSGLVILAGLCVQAGPASAFSFFGLFGSDDPPKPSPTTLPYRVAFTVVGNADVTSALQDSSEFYKLRQDAPTDADALVQRLKADFAPMLDALWGAGYYNAKLSATVGSVTLDLSQNQDEAAVKVAATFRNREAVPVTITADPGPLFTIRTVAVIDASTRQPFSSEVLPPRIVKLRVGDPARAADIRAADARLIDHFRDHAHPLVKSPLPSPTVDHAATTMDVTFVVDPGPVAGIGEVSVKGPDTFDPSIVRSFIYLDPGQPYSPKALADTRKSIGSIPAVGSVRIREGDRLDRNGNLPLFVDVTHRASNLIGFTAGFSTVDGPTASTYYENRNLFGGAERLRVQADAFLAPRIDGSTIKGFKDFKLADIGERFTIGFVKPALNGSRVDLLLDGIAERNRVGGGRFGGYEDRLAGGTAALRYRFDDTLSAQAGIKYERGEATDILGRTDYQLVGVPVSVKFDNTDKPLDPSRGIRASATVTPYPTPFGSSTGFTKATAAGSGYYALDDDSNYILAGRVGFGSIFGATGGLADIPANYRFYVGGVSTVRGYRYQTVSPLAANGFTTGGLSEFDGSVEARIKITDTIGIAPFFDIGGAYRGSVPFTGGGTRSAAGLGLMYYTPIGPIRVDVATPLTPRPGDRPVVLYVSIGQSF
ncbi:autotransporter assembly complex protein TamA [Lichenihabitans psoromatis]|uniref:autotransporter assembly complex protein TamA n=1 Tax=Lichenihabitans psoromatis TaxID=2528642 RepID=UPI0010358AF9|nr:BamA/TamA family outer membrane protein [Lichenihabitans psoromatis]